MFGVHGGHGVQRSNKNIWMHKQKKRKEKKAGTT